MLTFPDKQHGFSGLKTGSGSISWRSSISESSSWLRVRWSTSLMWISLTSGVMQVFYWTGLDWGCWAQMQIPQLTSCCRFEPLTLVVIIGKTTDFKIPANHPLATAYPLMVAGAWSQSKLIMGERWGITSKLTFISKDNLDSQITLTTICTSVYADCKPLYQCKLK